MIDDRFEIIHGDCIETMKQIGDCTIDCVVTDPPYGMAYVSSRRTRTDKFDAIEGDDTFDHDFHVSWLSEAYRVLKNDTHIYAFINDDNIGNMRECFRLSGFSVKRLIVWEKNNWTSGDLQGDYGHSTEFIIYGHKGRRELNGNRISNVIHSKRVNPKDLLHPTEKPTSVLLPLIEKSSNIGDIILDPFCGSGSTIMAANMLGRRSIGIEMVEKYVDISRDRMNVQDLFGSASDDGQEGVFENIGMF